MIRPRRSPHPPSEPSGAEADRDRDPSPPRHAGRGVIWVVTGFLALQVGWLLVMPPYRGIDEIDHAFRASSVAQGHLSLQPRAISQDLGRGDLIPVRSDIAQAARPACAKLLYMRPFNCQPFRQLAGDEVLVASGSARYNPAFYAYVGLVARPWHGDANLYAMRVASMLACCGLLALATRLTLAWARTGWPLVALLVAALPTTVYSSALAAPNGTEMMAGLAVWAAMLNLALAPRSLFAYGGLGAAAAILVNVHSLGLLCLALIVGCFGVLVGPGRLVRVLRPRGAAEMTIFLVASVSIVSEVAWLALTRPNDPSNVPPSITSSVWPDLPRQMILWPLQAIAAFPFRDDPAPSFVYAIGLSVLILLAWLGFRHARATQRLGWTLGIVVLLSYVVPVALTVNTFSRLGYAWQGRYGMPFTVGLLLLLGLAVDRSGRRLPPLLASVLAGALVVMQAGGQLHVLAHERLDRVLVDATGWWAPPAVLVVLVCVLAWAAWQRLAAYDPSVRGLPGPQGLREITDGSDRRRPGPHRAALRGDAT